MEDTYLHLEEVHSEAALDWVRARNSVSTTELKAHPLFADLQADALAVLNSKDKIPSFTRRGEYLYNFWEDSQYTRGVWRRTSHSEYRKAEPAWENLLDVAELGKREERSWTYSRAAVHQPSGRALISLSAAGSDARVVREFDLTTKSFLEGPSYFNLPHEAKSSVSWVDADTVLVATDFGPGSLTDSGYPRVVKLWRRGQPLAEATMVHEADVKDVDIWAHVSRAPPGPQHIVVGVDLTFYTSHEWLLRDGKLVRVPKPDDAKLSVWGHHVVIELRTDWHQWKAGSLLVGDLERFLQLAPDAQPALQALFVPTATASLDHFIATRACIVACILDNVVARVEEYACGADGVWAKRTVSTPTPGALWLASMDDEYLLDDPLAEAYSMSYTDFLTPTSLYQCATGTDARELLKTMPHFFDAHGMKTEQFSCASKDGTRVPYFVVTPPGFEANGTTPTILYGYGGFEISMAPSYSGVLGKSWVARGGCYVLANIRGGGEFGPTWHQAALKEKRQRAYDDFAAVAEDLIARRITSARHLGIKGGSNGGLLVATVMLQRPELFHAVMCQCPLIDMRRFNVLLAGASWMGEYGNPDTEDWAYLARYSPYHNVPPRGTPLPRVFFSTSTKDDRVHPAHARKMVARLEDCGHPVLLHENIEGGHSNAADNTQRAAITAMEYAFLWAQLK